ncbi:MAG: hypothetical protein Q7T36_11425 [Fluviicoccus sp.]|uniref:hypothetical protein n=1 Tax=Fluviicoccus sp. TaxID=2003552 RepID=UPI00271CC6FC|nr:hypothetical protein [Fluviicoccus sp.]MDO8331069.1 hypothetical protein [Fluviicoccus sp.]
MEIIGLALLGCIGVAAASGLLAARLRRMQRGQVAAVFLLTLIVTVSGTARWLKPSFPSLGIGSMATELAASQPFAELRQHDAELWEKTIAQITAHAHHGQTREDAASIIKSGLYYVMRRKIPESSNETAIQFISARMDELEHYASQGEELCYMLMEPPPGLVFRKAGKPPAALLQQLDLAMFRLIREAALTPQPVPNEEELAALLEKWSKAYPRTEDRSAMTATSASRPEQCLATVRATRLLLERPVDEAGLYVRMMYGLPDAQLRR